MVPALSAVLAEIARAVLGDAPDEDVTIGSITLRAHQREAVRRLHASLAEFGGALLADEPGLGKTYVALAVARGEGRAIVVAPAALRQMWRDAATSADARIEFVSVETLSRRDVRFAPDSPFVIVDEAHHACNPATARYARLARLVAHRRVLLMSATPVRNRRAELGALLALCMGPRAHALGDAALARCIVRRAGDASLLPAIDGPHWHAVRSVPGVRAMIESLPPPLPALDGREAAALLAISLTRCWASSLAALDAALRRRLQRGAAMEALLADGLLPTREELRSWVVGEDGVQLAFTMLASHATADAARLRTVLDRHLVAVRTMRERIRPLISGDASVRAALLRELRCSHSGARLLAFTSHTATAETLYRALVRERGVALLTARGARTAGGSRPQADVIRALGGGAAAHERDEISLVITTDLLSEGVNLQGASVIVHLDVPWTPAGLDQRVGRAARMGSPHACVHVHGISPPYLAERLLALERRLRKKHGESTAAAGAPDAAERLRSIVTGWRTAAGSEAGPNERVAGAFAPRTAFLAVVELQQRSFVVGGVCKGNRRWDVGDDPGSLAAIAGSVGAHEEEPEPSLLANARAALGRWLSDFRARASAGAGMSPSLARRSLLARLDGAVRGAPSHERAAQAARIARVRSTIGDAVSAGAEHTLRELSSAPAVDLASLLAACESALANTSARRGAPGEAPPAVRALLLLRRAP